MRPSLPGSPLAWAAGTVLSGSLFVPSKADMEWYASLDKPVWTPPDALFPVVWSVLNALLGWAAYLVLASGRLAPLLLFLLDRLLYLAWTPTFFHRRQVRLSVYLVDALLYTCATSVAVYASVGGAGPAALLLPYFGWLLFARLLLTRLR